METPRHRLCVILVAPRNPLNIGAAARAMSNFGVDCLRLVTPYEVAFREARSAVGASHVLGAAVEYQSLGDAVADCALVVGTTSAGHRELGHPLHRLEHAAPLVRAALAVGPVALLFGSEKYGLSNEDLTYCHWLLRIPARDEHGSMNLGQAVAVCLYELIRDPEAWPLHAAAKKPASAGDLERITDLALQILEGSGYMNPKTRLSTARKVRRLVYRLSLSARDAELLLGMLRQVRWRQGTPPGDQHAGREH